MRVIAGSAKGLRLAAVPAGTRPVADRARAVELARSLDPRRVAELVQARDYEELDWLILNHLMGS